MTSKNNLNINKRLKKLCKKCKNTKNLDIQTKMIIEDAELFLDSEDFLKLKTFENFKI